MWKEVGERIGTLRRERKLTMAQLGKMIGVSGQYVGKIERGAHRLRVDLIANICKSTGVSADYIIFGITDHSATVAVLGELSPTQIEIGFDILKRLAQMINTEYGNEVLIQEILRRQPSNGQISSQT